MQINKLLTPYNYNVGIADRIKWIVIHYVGALGGAEANCKWYAGADWGASGIIILILMDQSGSPLRIKTLPDIVGRCILNVVTATNWGLNWCPKKGKSGGRFQGLVLRGRYCTGCHCID